MGVCGFLHRVQTTICIGVSRRSLLVFFASICFSIPYIPGFGVHLSSSQNEAATSKHMIKSHNGHGFTSFFLIRKEDRHIERGRRAGFVAFPGRNWVAFWQPGSLGGAAIGANLWGLGGLAEIPVGFVCLGG